MELEQPLPSKNTKVAVISQKAPRTLWGDAWRQFRRHKLAMLGMRTHLTNCIICFDWTIFLADQSTQD